MALREQDPLPDWITHVASVEGQYVKTHSRGAYTPILENRKKATQASPILEQGEEGKELIDMKNINIKYADRHVSAPFVGNALGFPYFIDPEEYFLDYP